MPRIVPFESEDLKQNLLAVNSIPLEFTVVNNYTESVPYEQLPKYDFGELSPSQGAVRRETVGNTYNINTGTHMIVHTRLPDGFETNGAGFNQYDPNGIDFTQRILDNPQLASSMVSYGAENGLKYYYISRFSAVVEGQYTAYHNFANGHSVVIQSDNFGDPMTYNNVPLTPVIMVTGEETNEYPSLSYDSLGVESVVFMPLDWKNKFNLAQHELDDVVYKYHTYRLSPNETRATAVISDATYSLIYVADGLVTINGMIVDKFNFYEIDATTSIDIVNGSDQTTAIQITKVPTLGE